MFDRIQDVLVKLFLLAAFLILLIAVWGKLISFLGWRYTFAINYPPSKLLEYAAIMLLFGIALLLRQIRDEQAKPR